MAEAEGNTIDSAAGNVPREVSFRDFAALANRKGWTPEFLACEFRGKVDGPSEFFHRVLGGKHGDVAIPFHSVLDFYQKELSPLMQDEAVRLCVCGCQRRAHGRANGTLPATVGSKSTAKGH